MSDDPKSLLLDAILPHVVFEGWSEPAFRAAIADSGVSPQAARAACPRGAIDLAVAYHRRGDAQMLAAWQAKPPTGLRYSEKVAHLVWSRLAGADKDIVRRGSALFALPHMAPRGAALIWGTADAIWNALGDTSDDLNWYSKRAILSGVYGSVVLFWLGDASVDGAATRDFIDRRIADVMRVEKVKAQVAASPLFRPFAGAATRFAAAFKPPRRAMPPDLPGHWTPQ
mgnify:CR=1 FL=1